MNMAVSRFSRIVLGLKWEQYFLCVGYWQLDQNQNKHCEREDLDDFKYF